MAVTCDTVSQNRIDRKSLAADVRPVVAEGTTFRAVVL